MDVLTRTWAKQGPMWFRVENDTVKVLSKCSNRCGTKYTYVLHPGKLDINLHFLKKTKIRTQQSPLSPEDHRDFYGFMMALTW